MSYATQARDPYSNQTKQEEVANTVTHGIGTGLAIAGLVLLVVFAGIEGSAMKVISFAVYGTSLVLLYLMSTIYHAVQKNTLKKGLQLMDHASIYLLIAGSYTPIMLVSVKGAWGWSLFGVLWGLAIVGIVLKIRFVGEYEIMSTVIYLIMGWLIVLFSYPILTYLSPMAIAWLFIGGGAYSIGTVFFFMEKLPFHHAIWHLFVLGGSISHFFLFLFHVLPGK